MSYSAECRRESFISESDLALLSRIDLAALERPEKEEPSTPPAGRSGGGGVVDPIEEEEEEVEWEDEGSCERRDSVDDSSHRDDEHDDCREKDGRRGRRRRTSRRRSSVIKMVYESSRTRVYRLRGVAEDGHEEAENFAGEASGARMGGSFRTFCGCGGDLAIKSFVDPTPPPEMLSRLYNEYNVLTSDHLRGCSCIRRAVRKDKVDGLHALYLEWVEGATVRDWLRGRRQRGGSGSSINAAVERSRLLEAVRLALRLVEGLAEIHSRGVRHNNICAKNIIIAEDQEKWQHRGREREQAFPSPSQPISGSQPLPHSQWQLCDGHSTAMDFRVIFIDFALASLEESAAVAAAAAVATDRKRSSALPLPMRCKSSFVHRDSIASASSTILTVAATLSSRSSLRSSGIVSLRSSMAGGGNKQGSVVSHRGSAASSHRGSMASHRGSVASSHRGSVSSAGHRCSIDSCRGSVTSVGRCGSAAWHGPPHVRISDLSLVLEEDSFGSSSHSQARSGSEHSPKICDRCDRYNQDYLDDDEEDGDVYDEGIAGDLRDLGAVIGRIFSQEIENLGGGGLGQVPRGGGIRRESSGALSSCSSLLLSDEDEDLDSGAVQADRPTLPRSLQSVVYDMVGCAEGEDGTTGQRMYRSASEVASDLRWLIQEPDKFLFDPPALPASVGGVMPEEATEAWMRLDLDPGRLYGRECEEAVLTEAHKRLCLGENDQKELVLVGGSSGTGKSTLVKSVFDRLSKDCGGGSCHHFFVTGKFDPVCRREPYSAIVEAFTELCDRLLNEADSAYIDKLSCDIEDAIGSPSNARDLATIVPRISEIVRSLSDGQQWNGDHRKVALDSKNAENRFNFLFCTFVRTVATPDHPVVLFLDDCQWADAASLNLVRMLLKDAESSSFLIVAAYRIDETMRDSPIMKVCDGLGKSNVLVTRIETGNLTVESAGAIISDATRLTPRVTRPLARIIRRKTRGNVFFLLQFLKKLCDEGLLYFSRDVMTWCWDEELIEGLDITENVVELMADMIANKISDEAQRVLKIAACLGSQFTVSTLRLIVDTSAGPMEYFGDSFDLINTLDMAVAKGMVVRTRKEGEYKFAHDRIQQAAYSLIPPAERASYHLEIGEQIARDPTMLEGLIFIAVGQLNLGASLVNDPADRTRLARLNLKAAERAMAASAFSFAAGYLRAGLGVIKRTLWKDNYELSLRLHVLLADIERCTGDFSEMEDHLREVFLHARTMKDKLPAHIAQIKSLGAQYKMSEAVDAGFDVLSRYGMGLPKTVNKRKIVVEFLRTKAALRGKSNEQIISLPDMTVETKLAAMEVFCAMSVYVFMRRPQYVPLIVFRMVRLSIKYGLCRLSALAFAHFAWLLTAGGKHLNTARRFGHLASLIVERFRTQELVASVQHMTYGFSSHWWEHIELSIGPLFTAFRAGLETGDVETAGLCARSYALAAFQSGRPLSPLEHELRKFCNLLMENKQTVGSFAMRTSRQVILNLLGRSDDAVVLKGEAIDLPAVLRSDHARQSGGKLEFFFHSYTLQLAYLFGRYRLAADAASKCREMSRKREFSTRYIACAHAFYDGLNTVALAREERYSSWRGIAKGAMKTMKRWLKHTPQNCLHKILLLEAEIATLEGYPEKARTAYDKAIAAGCRNGFTQDVAVGCERAALFLLDSGKKIEALDYFSRARQFYLEWGAVAKVEHVDGQMAKHFQQ